MNTLSENFSINKKNNNILKYFSVAIALIFFIALVNFFGMPIKNYFFAVSSPVEKTFWSAGESSSGFLNSFLSAAFFSKENENLKNENERLISQIIVLQQEKSASQAQSEILLNSQGQDYKMIMAAITGLEEDGIVSINKGSDDGISEGMPVVSQQNVAFGKIGNVYKNFSEVILLSNKKNIVNVEIKANPAIAAAEAIEEEKGEIDGVVKGAGNLNIYLDLVKVDSEIKEGDILITSALEKIFPKNLLIGKISKITKDDQKPFQQAQIEPFFSLKDLDNVFVITNYKR